MYIFSLLGFGEAEAFLKPLLIQLINKENVQLVYTGEKVKAEISTR